MKKRISKKKGIILIVISLLIITISLTYAFMGSNIGIGSKTDINLNSYDVDRFTFSKGSDISISATTANFSSGASNIASSTTATASLKANSDNNSANKTYNLYLNIDNNNFVYSSASTPELLLTITDPSGNAVTSLTNLSYVTSSGVSGFDITTKTGLIKIADNYQISSSSSTSATTQTWNITITLLALTIDQSPNEGKILSADVIIQKDNYLPSDYTKLTYLQSSGTQYIDTNYIMQSGTEKVYIDFEKTDVSGDTSLCGSEYPSGSARAFSLILHGASTSSIYCGIGATIGLATAVNTRYQTTMLATGGNITGTHYDVTNNSSSSISTTYSTTNGLFSSIPYSIALFANHTSLGVSQIVSAKIYSFKIWDNNLLVRNFIPALNSNSVAGMYDLVNGVFYPNAGSGTFSY